MTREDIESEYTIIRGVIQDAGRFESEAAYAPYFYAAVMDGGCETIDFADGQYVDVVEVDDNDRAMWPELAASIFAIGLEVSDQGFVRVVELTETELDNLRTEAEEDEEEEEEEEDEDETAE
jgi:hypothetical protein